MLELRSEPSGNGCFARLHDFVVSVIRTAVSNEEICACYPVLAELRPHLQAEEFLARYRRMHEQGFRLGFLEDSGVVRAVAGFRLNESLAWGKYLYVDDLVTREADRSRGYGAQLLEWLRSLAISNGCSQLHLDSGVHRFGAHRFYLTHRMDITSHHFALTL